MKKRLLKPQRSLLLILAVTVMGFVSHIAAYAALTPEQVAQKAAAAVSSSKGLSASFSISMNGRISKGTIKSAGTKFSVITPDVSTWYNGKALYTYNPRTAETTVTVPTAQELAESNPLLYVRSGASGFTCRFSTVKRQGKYILDLLPKNTRTGLKKLTFTINASNYHIEKIAVTTSSGSSVVDVTSLKIGQTIPASDFEYPKSRYPKAEIVDLR